MPRRSLSQPRRASGSCGMSCLVCRALEGFPVIVFCPFLSVWPWRAVLSCFVLSCLFSPGGLLIPPHFPGEFFFGGGGGSRVPAVGARLKGSRPRAPKTICHGLQSSQLRHGRQSSQLRHGPQSSQLHHGLQRTMITGILLIGLGFALVYRIIQKTATAVQSTRLPVMIEAVGRAVSIETETINRNMDSIMEKLTALQRKIDIGDQNGQRE